MANRFWEKIEPGNFDKRVTFCKPGKCSDGYGKTTNGLKDVATLWAEFYPIRGRELYEVQKIQGTVTHKCKVRYNSMIADIDSTWYLKYKGRRYAVESAIDDGMAHRCIEIQCALYIDSDTMPDDPTALSTEDPGEILECEEIWEP